MEGKRVLVLDSNKQLRKTACRALIATQSEVDPAASREEALALLAERHYDLIFADLEFADLIAQIKATQKRCRTALTSQARIEDYLSELRRLGFICNLIAKSSEGQHISARELITTSEKLLRNDVFGLNKYLRWGTEAFHVEVCDSRKRFQAIENVLEYAEKLGAQDRMQRIITDLLDELFMNAFYDAPLDEEGKFKYANLNRSIPVIFPPNEPVTLEFACDGDYLGVSIADNWGTLNKEKIFLYLERCFAKGNNQVEEKEGGAGLGLYKIFKSLNMFVVNIEPGVKTEAIGLIDLRVSVREFKKQVRSFHIFNKEDFTA